MVGTTRGITAANTAHAIPQLYVEAGYGDLSVKAGHFYTIIGYEVVQATGNFFYSHAYTFNFSEPFTHTGVLATYNANDNVTVYGGYTLGWDSGFDDNGDAFLGGISVQSDRRSDVHLRHHRWTISRTLVRRHASGRSRVTSTRSSRTMLSPTA